MNNFTKKQFYFYTIKYFFHYDIWNRSGSFQSSENLIKWHLWHNNKRRTRMFYGKLTFSAGVHLHSIDAIKVACITFNVDEKSE